ncbi:MAG: hypothetical protein A3E36_00425 [Candidatus Andersenbacteria bacterium RIFCSPHIGHO2_12_FULL_45_11b]|uniref:Glycosyltransferase 2-like domain-containing protein n=1 Tax=Candidatus Andersenbacteria bacterium RIFCSPHIGHO2_12_FULL_45_11b TaxID=1797282 RepID=A0A1G1XAS1_9BACT|nr:MAG: hypothetical protein A3E36_00425 [Candidatus Andersenbacteria bacterium RIFCSPHIGHO2_12_FULL_45_11b]
MRTQLAVVIPALNEEKTIGAIIDRIPGSLPGISDVRIIVVNDGSTDNTSNIASEKGALVISHATPTGVGYAFQIGIKKALEIGADYIVNIDADGQFNPEDIPLLLAPIIAGTSEFVTATRFARAELLPEMPVIKIWGNKWMVRIINAITSKKFTDVSCGFRAYTREAALRLTLFGRFTYTQESFIDLAFKGIAMTEVPLRVRGQREFGTSRVASNLWRYGIKAITIIFHAARDYKPFYFIGAPGIAILSLGVCSTLFIAWHYIATGQTSPYRSLVTASGVCIIIGFLLIFISFIAEMTHRNRVLIEEALYLARKSAYGNRDHK